MAGALAFPSLAMNMDLSDLKVPPGVLVAFAAFFLLGYLLYSALYAAIGAITTTEQEGQQLQFIIVIPLVLSVFMLSSVVKTPDAPIVAWLSIFPFFAPVLMYARIVIQTPPVWQIALSLVLLIATIAGPLLRALRAHLPRRCAHLRQAPQPAGNSEVAKNTPRRSREAQRISITRTSMCQQPHRRHRRSRHADR